MPGEEENNEQHHEKVLASSVGEFATDEQQSKKVCGVNYGNRFIPEDWMGTEETFYKNVRPNRREPGKSLKTKKRVCLADLSESQFRERMLSWLDEHIQECHFVQMSKRGINVVRIPTGYWNWITLAEGNNNGDDDVMTTPNGPDRKRMQVLHTHSPDEYRPYFDRIFAHAQKYDIQVLLDLHGLPGSQNGEMHSGLVVPEPAFDTDWNKEIAVRAVSAMAAYGKKRQHDGTVLYGLQVMNEPSSSHIDHDFLDTYYRESITAARQHLDMDIPVVVFAWTCDFHKWKDQHYDNGLCGRVLWDTHIYHVESSDCVEHAEEKYKHDLEQLRHFHQRQLCRGSSTGGGGAIVGEWSLAGPCFDNVGNEEFAMWLIAEFATRCHGSIFWNFDGPSIREWNWCLLVAETNNILRWRS